MAQPNVSREPSMEEILASIRRIIESNEPVGPGRPFNAVQAYEPGDGDARQGDPGRFDHERFDDTSFDGAGGQRNAFDDSAFDGLQLDPGRFDGQRGDGGRTDALRADLRLREPVRPAGDGLSSDGRRPDFDLSAGAMALPVPANQSAPIQGVGQPAVAKTLSLADLAARVRASAERMSEDPPTAPLHHRSENTESFQRQTPDTTGDPSRFGDRSARDEAVRPARGDAHQPGAAEARFADSRASGFQADPSPLEIRPAPMAVADNPSSLSLSGSAVGTDPDRSEPRPLPIAPLSQAPAAEPSRPEVLALLSSTAGAQVARSFEELAAAVDDQPRRSLETIAEDMLRPMLQTWLDDNLPNLVERLVREEIERIARGPRR